MKFITVLHVFSAMVLAVVAAPVHDAPDASPARAARDLDGQAGSNSDVFESLDLARSTPVPAVTPPDTNEGHPQAPHSGCVIA
ncbi:hypothetical protein C8R46DRAFT_1352164 [Mycena filopes]|nr:hypothetical protein C8R46DRAFT_1352164 [Mycena filopes]